MPHDKVHVLVQTLPFHYLGSGLASGRRSPWHHDVQLFLIGKGPEESDDGVMVGSSLLHPRHHSSVLSTM